VLSKLQPQKTLSLKFYHFSQSTKNDHNRAQKQNKSNAAQRGNIVCKPGKKVEVNWTTIKTKATRRSEEILLVSPGKK